MGGGYMKIKYSAACGIRHSFLFGRCIPMAVLLMALSINFAFSEQVDLHVWGLNMGEPRFGWYALISAFERKHPGVRIVIGPTERSSESTGNFYCGIAVLTTTFSGVESVVVRSDCCP
jgi:hypothetical protein